MRATILAIALSVTSCAPTEEPSQSFPAIELKWSGPFGMRGKDQANLFVPCAAGFLSMPFMGSGSASQCKDVDARISGWLKQHPSARAIPVIRTPFGEEVTFTYIWLVDNTENFNLELVRDHCCSPEDMLVRGVAADLLVDREQYSEFERAVQEIQKERVQERLEQSRSEEDNYEVRWIKAKQLEQEGMFAAAIPEFAMAGMSHEYEGSNAWYRIAKCYERLGQYEDALYAYDKSIALNPAGMMTRIAAIDKAILVAKNEGPEKAAALIGFEVDNCAESLEPCRDVAAVYESADRGGKAAEILEDGIELFIEHQRIKFSGSDLVWEENRVNQQDPYWMSLQELSFTLCPLGRSMERLGREADALHYANMGLSVRQGINAHLAKNFRNRFTPKAVEAGDLECRLLRARLFAVSGSLEQALSEIGHARTLAEAGDAGGLARAQIAETYAELKKRFPKSGLDIPENYESIEDLLPLDVTRRPQEQTKVRGAPKAISAVNLDRKYPDRIQRENAERDKWIRENELHSIDGWDHIPSIRLEMRFVDATHHELLLRCDHHKVTYLYDLDVDTLTKVSESVWSASHEPVHSGAQIGQGDLRWLTESHAVAYTSNDGLPLSCGKLFSYTLSPTHRAMAVASDPFNGESGCLQLYAVPSRSPLGDPLSNDGQTSAYWSPDERYLFFADPKGKWIVGSGLKPLNPAPEDPEGQTCKVKLEGSKWLGWNTKKDPDLLCRYERENSPILLMKALLRWPPSVKPPRTAIFYRFDPADGKVTEVGEDAWDRAEGPVWKQYEMIGAGQVLMAGWARDKLFRLDREIEVPGHSGVVVSLAPGLSRALVLSLDDPRADFFYQQVYKLPEGEPIGEPTRIPIRLIDERGRSRKSSPRPWAWFPDDSHAVYLNYNRKAIYIVPTQLSDGLGSRGN